MKVKNSKYDIFINISCLLCLIGTIIYLIIIWNTIPNEIPGHYNALGEVDKITNKSSLIVLPIISWIMYIGLSVVELFPQIWNTGVTVTQENQQRVYRILKNMLVTIKFFMVVSFTYLSINSAKAISLSPLFTPLVLVLIFGSIIFFIIKLVKAK